MWLLTLSKDETDDDNDDDDDKMDCHNSSFNQLVRQSELVSQSWALVNSIVARPLFSVSSLTKVKKGELTDERYQGPGQTKEATAADMTLTSILTHNFTLQ